MPRTPLWGSRRIWISASCSLTPSSSRAASTASSTLGALLSTSRIPRTLRPTGGAASRGLGRRTTLNFSFRLPGQHHLLLSDLPGVGRHPIDQDAGGDLEGDKSQH